MKKKRVAMKTKERPMAGEGHNEMRLISCRGHMKCNGRLGGFYFFSSSSRRNGCVCVHCLAHGNTICNGVFYVSSLCIAPVPPPKFYTSALFTFFPIICHNFFPREA